MLYLTSWTHDLLDILLWVIVGKLLVRINVNLLITNADYDGFGFSIRAMWNV
jgi:hypothetical protein